MMYRFVFFSLWLLSLASCKRETLSLVTQELPSGTNLDLNYVHFKNDRMGYVCGGSRYAQGIFLRTLDGGNTWLQDSICPKALYTMHFFDAREGFVAGFDSWWCYTSDSGKTFSTRTLPCYRPVNDITFRNRQQGLIAIGYGYGQGKYIVTTDGGNSLPESPWDTLHAYNCCAYPDDNTMVIGGYGTILRSNDGGHTFQVIVQNGDFYQAMEFPSSTLGFTAGYQGEILRTRDGGLSWQIVKSTNGPWGKQDHFLGMHFIDEHNGAAVGENGLMLITHDGGENWERVKCFTDGRLRGVQLFTPTTGIVVGEGGKIIRWQQ